MKLLDAIKFVGNDEGTDSIISWDYHKLNIDPLSNQNYFISHQKTDFW